jgi:hypothetical protein
MAMERQNDQKIINCICAKVWDELVIVAQQCPPLPKPTLVKLVLEQLLQVLGLNAWGMGSMFQGATSWMEKDENLKEMIRSICFAYAQQLKMAWDVKNWDRKSTKVNWT